MNKRIAGTVVMVISALGLAIAGLMMKLIPIYTQMSPQHIAIWRFTLAAPMLWVIDLIRKKPNRIRFKQPWRFFVLGFFYSLSSLSAVFALQRLSLSIYIIIFYIYPSIVVLYALLTGAAVPQLFWLGMPLTLVGLLMTSFEFGSKFSIDPVGILFTFANAGAMAIYMILSEKVFTSVDDKLAGTTAVLTGGVLVGILMIPFLGIRAPDSLLGWAMLVVFAIFGTVMPILTMNFGLSLLTSVRGSIIITVQPVFNILLGMLFLNESLSFQQWVGGGLVVLAVLLLEFSPDRVLKRAVKTNNQLPR